MLKRRENILIYSVVLVGLLVLPQVIHSQYIMRLTNVAGVYLLLVVGFNILYGLTGQLSFGHAGFFGIGAYAVGVATVHYGLPVLVGFAGAVLLSILFGLAVGFPTLKLKGHYLAVATIAFGEIVRQILLNWKEVTGGYDGILGIPAITIAGFSFKEDQAFFYIILAFAIVGILIGESIKRSTYGRAMFATSDSEVAAEVVGVDTTQIKVLAFVISAIYAGVAGALYSHLFGYISPDAFDFKTSVTIVAMLLVGGTGSTIGAAVGAILLTLLPEVLRVSDQYYMVIYGVIFLLILVFLPGGMVDVWNRLVYFINTHRKGKETPKPILSNTSVK